MTSGVIRAALKAAMEQGVRQEQARILKILERTIVARQADAIHPFNRHLPAAHVSTGGVAALRELANTIKRGEVVAHGDD